MPRRDCCRGNARVDVIVVAGEEAIASTNYLVLDGGDEPDLQMAREHLSCAIADPLRAAQELARCRAAAERLVRSAWAQGRIRVLAEALLRCGTLSGEEIHRI